MIRQQFKEGADFIKIYETGRDSFENGKLSTPYQYTEAELTCCGRGGGPGGETRGACTRRENPAPFTLHERAWKPSIMPINSATKR